MNNDIEDKFINQLLDNKGRTTISLADGSAGDLFVLEQLREVADEESEQLYTILMKAILAKVRATRWAFAQTDLGLLTGILGLSAVIDTIFEQTQNQYWQHENNGLYSSIRQELLYLADDVDEDHLDWIFGMAGVLMYVANCKIALNDEKKERRFECVYSKMLLLVKGYIKQTGVRDGHLYYYSNRGVASNIGLAHGLGGLLIALSDYEKNILHVSSSELTYIAGLYSEAVESELDVLDHKKVSGGINLSWCFGLAGEAGVLRKIEDRCLFVRTNDCILRGVTGFNERYRHDVNFYSLCHGLSGMSYVNYSCNNFQYTDIKLDEKIQPITLFSDDIGSVGLLSGMGGYLAVKSAICHGKRMSGDWILGF